jgi:hypothetical protein
VSGAAKTISSTSFSDRAAESLSAVDSRRLVEEEHRNLAALRRRGVEAGPDLTRGAASALLDVALAGAALAPATAEQVWRPQRMGVAVPAGLTRREAPALIEAAMRGRRR